MTWFLICSAVISLFYFNLLWNLFGFTFGELLLRLRVIMLESRRRITAKSAILRSGSLVTLIAPVGAVVLLTFLNIYHSLTLIFNKENKLNQIDCDYFSKTYVVDLAMTDQN